ncbi:Glyco-transf-90 domain containing protein [Pyrenophora teres f. maculata]|nr:Glyco-transf-90 domain containing protein [Pyrenophora teres f. maculata]
MLMRKMWIVEERKDKTVYRRRCPTGTEVLSFFFVTACALLFLLICTIIYGTRTQNPSLPPLVKEYMPAGRCQCEFSTTFSCDTCLDCAATQSVLTANATQADDQNLWTFTYPRDKNNYGLDEAQCASAFPGQYEDIERAVKVRDRSGKVTEAELNSFELTKGMVRAMVFDRELYVLETHLVDNINRQKALAILSAIYRALLAAPANAHMPNIEFTFSVEDLPAQPAKPIWSLTRRVQDHSLWLMPDFGFWSWDMPSLGTLDEVAREAVQRETREPWNQKIEKLVWRGKITFAPKLRRALLDAAKGKPWSDVGQLRWTDPNFKEQFLGPVDQCNYMFIAHAEGRSYSGSLKYRQLCRSVIISHKLQWIQHHHYLFRANGSNQNYVEVERDFSDLASAVEDLLDHPEKAKRIADNSVQVFRERYLTQAAEACYWRRLMTRWKDVMSWEPVLYSGGDSVDRNKEKKRGVRYETFMLYEPKAQLFYPEPTH